MQKTDRSYPFSIRIYGILIHDNKLLVTEEKWFGMRMIKLPGGGLEYGEAPVEALKREFMEECGVEIVVGKLLHTPKQFIPAIFYNLVQVVPIYYKVECSNPEQIALSKQWHSEAEMNNSDVFFHWVNISDLSPELFSFPGDKEMAALLKDEWK
jgi:8-oxo-dGTP pyrophosphatase MutT (NUDIX family)